jgi:hypothetical protein
MSPADPPMRATRRRRGHLPGFGSPEDGTSQEPVTAATVADATRHDSEDPSALTTPVTDAPPNVPVQTTGHDDVPATPKPAPEATDSPEPGPQRVAQPAAETQHDVRTSVRTTTQQPAAHEPEPAADQLAINPVGAQSREPAPRNRAPRTAAKTSRAPSSPYAGARARHFNIRLMDPLRDRYNGLVRELSDQGVDTNVSELMHALMAEGPQQADEARALLQRWRIAKAGL